MQVKFKLIKSNGHLIYEGCLEEKCLKTFLRGSQSAKIVYIKDGAEYTILNEGRVRF
jgi:hypothetical protein